MIRKLVEGYVSSKYSDEHKRREQYGVIGGAVGIVCNIVLCVFKFILGSLTNSVSITADAVNNLSDAGSNVVSVAGAKLANKPVDKDHPFGHGRIEYISALVVAFLIFLMAFELAKSSLQKIVDPQAVNFSITYIIILVVAIAMKLGLAYFNHVLYGITGNINMKAVKKDCINDAMSTGATMIALVVSEMTGFYMIDGAMGIGVSVVIALAGVGIVKDIMGPLLGEAPDKELVEGIEKIVMSKDAVVGIHDLIVHDYGPGRRIASVHAEVPADGDMVEIHDVIDNIEVELYEKLGIVVCVHTDPVVVGDEIVEKYKSVVRDIITAYNAEYSFHDFRMVQGPTHTNLLFDLVVPAEHRAADDGEILRQIKSRFKEYDSTINVVARVEHSYV